MRRHESEVERMCAARATAGPVDLVMLKFPGNRFNGGIEPALRELVEKGTVRVLDLLFVYKGGDGTVGSGPSWSRSSTSTASSRAVSSTLRTSKRWPRSSRTTARSP